MQFLITVNDPTNGLGNSTEQYLAEQVEHMVGLWDRMPGIRGSVEAYEDDVFPRRDVCPVCSQPLTVEGDTDGTGDPQHVFCDICDRAEHPADLTADWNGETGQHLSCEGREFDRIAVADSRKFHPR